MKNIYKIESLNIVSCDLVYGYNRLTGKIVVDDYDKISKNKEIIILPYKDDLITFTEALSIYEDYIYRTTGVFLDYPRHRINRYLKDVGYYFDIQEFQERIALFHGLKIIKQCFLEK